MRAATFNHLAGVVTLVGALGLPSAAPASPPARASGTSPPPAKNCVQGQQAKARAAGDSGGVEGATPKFSAAFYKRLFTLDVSLDGAEGTEFPISIEQVCNVPKARAKEAAQLPGADGVALRLHQTSFWQGRTRLRGTAADVALYGADTATLKVRLAPLRQWRKDEDGNQVPTFRVWRVDITD